MSALSSIRAPERRRVVWSHDVKRLSLAPNEVAFIAQRALVLIVARLGDGYPSLGGGYGGWASEPRPGQVSATTFAGSDSHELPIPIILGRWPSAGSIEAEIADLEQLAERRPGAPRGERPPSVRVRGAVPHRNVRWVINDLQWGEVTTLARQRVYAELTVVLKQHVATELVAIPPARQRGDGGRGGTVKVLEGDLRGDHPLMRIAQRLDDHATHREITEAARKIRKANNIRDPKRLRAGQVLKLS